MGFRGSGCTVGFRGLGAGFRGLRICGQEKKCFGASQGFPHAVLD